MPFTNVINPPVLGTSSGTTYTITSTQDTLVPVDAHAGSVTVVLPSGTAGQQVGVKTIHTYSTNRVTVKCSSTDVLNRDGTGSTSFPSRKALDLSGLDDVVVLQYYPPAGAVPGIWYVLTAASATIPGTVPSGAPAGTRHNFLNVKEFGARGDGQLHETIGELYPANGIADLIAQYPVYQNVQPLLSTGMEIDYAAALVACQLLQTSSPSGGIIFFPRGTYRFNYPLQIAKSSITLLGEGTGDAGTATGVPAWSPASTILWTGASSAPNTILQFSHVQGCGVRDLAFDGASAATWAIGCVDVVQHCRFENLAARNLVTDAGAKIMNALIPGVVTPGSAIVTGVRADAYRTLIEGMGISATGFPVVTGTSPPPWMIPTETPAVTSLPLAGAQAPYTTSASVSTPAGSGTFSVPLNTNLTIAIPVGKTITLVAADGSRNSQTLTVATAAQINDPSITVNQPSATGYTYPQNSLIVVNLVTVMSTNNIVQGMELVVGVNSANPQRLSVTANPTTPTTVEVALGFLASAPAGSAVYASTGGPPPTTRISSVDPPTTYVPPITQPPTQQTFPTTTFTVVSTANFPQSGSLSIAGVTGTVNYSGTAATNYSGTNGTQFLNCTGGSGDATIGGAVTAPLQATTAVGTQSNISNPGSITVVSTAGFPSTGVLAIAGLGVPVTYSAIVGTQFQQCSIPGGGTFSVTDTAAVNYLVPSSVHISGTQLPIPPQGSANPITLTVSSNWGLPVSGILYDPNASPAVLVSYGGLQGNNQITGCTTLTTDSLQLSDGDYVSAIASLQVTADQCANTSQTTTGAQPLTLLRWGAGIFMRSVTPNAPCATNVVENVWFDAPSLLWLSYGASASDVTWSTFGPIWGTWGDLNNASGIEISHADALVFTHMWLFRRAATAPQPGGNGFGVRLGPNSRTNNFFFFEAGNNNTIWCECPVAFGLNNRNYIASYSRADNEYAPSGFTQFLQWGEYGFAGRGLFVDQINLKSPSGVWQQGVAMNYAVFAPYKSGGYTWQVPPGFTQVRIRAVSGGGGGGGAGSSSGLVAQVGGAGGMAGNVVDQVVSVSPGESLTVSPGQGGSGGAGAAPTATRDGLPGQNGQPTTVTVVRNSVTVTLISAPGTISQALGSSGTNSTTVVPGPIYGTSGSSSTPTEIAPGSGGSSAASSGLPFLNVVGGAGGGTADNVNTKGGGSGGAQQAGLYLSVQNPPVGANTVQRGANGTDATQAGCGGGGGGGGINTGPLGGIVGGTGGKGGDGQVEIWW